MRVKMYERALGTAWEERLESKHAQGISMLLVLTTTNSRVYVITEKTENAKTIIHPCQDTVRFVVQLLKGNHTSLPPATIFQSHTTAERNIVLFCHWYCIFQYMKPASRRTLKSHFARSG